MPTSNSKDKNKSMRIIERKNMNKKIVRTRFAPSPTGYMHIGNLRTALFAYLVAKSNGGKFILRIEDTDRDREVTGSDKVIYTTLKDTNLIWDEGPDVGGDFGPYIQSERKSHGIYSKYAELLIDKKHAYRCFCSKDRLDKLRELQKNSKIPPKYDGCCQNLSNSEIQKKIDDGESYVIRQKIPKSGHTSFRDSVYGEISVENVVLDDGILLKADRYPTYNFANVIDDHLMQITHVIRGSEYLSSTPRYNLLYKALDWEIPEYIHVPPVMKSHDKKLSKREGDASYEDFIKKGYVKEAILNYIVLLGWSPQSEREKFSVSELTQIFSIKGISKSPAIFDENKLSWLSGEYIRDMTSEQFYDFSRDAIENTIKNPDINKFEVSKLLQKRCEKISEIPDQIDFFDVIQEYSTELFINKKMKTDKQSSLKVLKSISELILNKEFPENDWSFNSLHDKLMELIKKLEIKNGQLLFPLRVALSGKEFTPGGSIDIACILGRAESMKRINHAIKLLSVSLGCIS